MSNQTKVFISEDKCSLFSDVVPMNQKCSKCGSELKCQIDGHSSPDSVPEVQRVLIGCVECGYHSKGAVMWRETFTGETS